MAQMNQQQAAYQAFAEQMRANLDAQIVNVMIFGTGTPGLFDMLRNGDVIDGTCEDITEQKMALPAPEGEQQP